MANRNPRNQKLTAITLTSYEPLSKERIDEIHRKIHELYPDIQYVFVEHETTDVIVEKHLNEISHETYQARESGVWPEFEE